MATTKALPIDLTPFGFTPTESLAYSALLKRGPTSAYALAKSLNLARANVYQALNGLAGKGAALQVDESPKVFRAIDPSALLALVSEGTAARLDRLDSQLARQGAAGAPATIEFSSERAFRELALRTAVRAELLVCIAQGDVLRSLNPLWRKRAADASETSLWAVGEAPTDCPIAIVGTIPPGSVLSVFDASAVLLVTGEAALVGRWEEGHLRGYWTSDPILRRALRGVVEALTPA